jgi:hypothetical protein
LPYFAFVEFKDIECATTAFSQLKDFKFKPDDRPLSIDYDRVCTRDVSTHLLREFRMLVNQDLENANLILMTDGTITEITTDDLDPER